MHMDSDSNRLYLGHLPPTATEDDVLKHLSEFGTITHIRIFPGYGWVTLSSSEDAKAVVDIFSRRRFMDADVNVEYAKPYKGGHAGNRMRSLSPPVRESREQYTSESREEKYPVVVDNLHPRTAWQELKDFGRMAGGTVVYCTLDKHKRGRGYVEYASKEDADLSARKLDGMILKGSPVSVVAIDPSRRDRVSKSSRERSRSPVRSMRSYPDGHRNWHNESQDRVRSNSELGPPRAAASSGPSYNQYNVDRFKSRDVEWNAPRTSAHLPVDHDRTKSQGDEWGSRSTPSRSNYDNHSFRSSTSHREPPPYSESRGRDDRPAYNDRTPATAWSYPKAMEGERALAASWSQPQTRNEERTSAVAIPSGPIKGEEQNPNQFFSSYESLAEMNRIAMEWLKAHSSAGPSNTVQQHT